MIICQRSYQNLMTGSGYLQGINVLNFHPRKLSQDGLDSTQKQWMIILKQSDFFTSH